MNKIVKRKIADLIPYANNAKEHTPKQIENLKKSLTEFGWVCPCVIKNNVLIVGHGRIQAAKELGWEYAECIERNDLTDEQADAYRLLDNLLSEGGYDGDKIKTELQKVDISGYDFAEIDTEIQGINVPIGMDEPTEVVEDEIPEEAEPRCKLGDLYILGNHRLLCGDSTDVAVIDRLMDGVKADMVFTDPPYGVAYKVKASASDGNTISEARKNGCKNEKIQNDDSLEKAYQISVNAFSLLKNTETFYICCDWKCYATIKAAVEDAGIIPKALIVWDKGGPYQHLDLFAKRHEFIIYAGKYGGEKTVDTDIWSFPREFRSDHPTPKPIELIAHAIKCQKNIENVLDIFGGSGSTLIACEQLNRKCYMIELEPKYCDVIIQRWENFTGQKAVKI